METICDALRRLDKSGAKVAGGVVNCVKELNVTSAYNYGQYGRYGRYGRHGSAYGTRRSGKGRRKTDQEHEWDSWEKNHGKGAEDVYEDIVILEDDPQTVPAEQEPNE